MDDLYGNALEEANDEVKKANDEIEKAKRELEKYRSEFRKSIEEIQKVMKPLGNTNNNGSQAPSYGSGSQTPSYASGSQTPSYGSGSYASGSQTPSYGSGYQAPSYASGSQTPSYGSGYQAPSYASDSQNNSHNSDYKYDPYRFTGTKDDDGDKKQEDNSNPYGFDVTKITDDEEIIEDYIKQGLPIFLHGLSGCGKSARVKELDPNCKIIYLASATPETLIGKSAVINGVTQDIPPTWYTELCKRCEEDPDHIHIVFFDELTNANKNLMGYAYNIVLDREIDGKWKLPENARIVAAGNEADESIAATKMPEPLFRRFNHVNVVTTLNKWLLWASKHDIHPAIYAFVASRGEDSDKQILRTKCDGKNNCVDPRKWEMASKMLKATNNPAKLKCIIGDRLTQEFINFIKIDIITLSQVLNGEYKEEGRIEISKAARSLPGLAAVDENNIKVVRDFVYKHMYPEQVKQFKIYWTRRNKERCRILDEFDIEDKLNNDQNKSIEGSKKVM